MRCQDAVVTEAIDEQLAAATWYHSRRAIIGPAIALTATLVGVGFPGARTVGGPGELPRVKPRFSNVIGTFEPGKDIFSAGFLAIRDKGKDIEILKVEARTSPNVEYIDAGAQWPRDVEHNGSNPGNGFGFPLEFGKVLRQHPAFGVRIPAKELAYVPKGWERPSDLWVIVGFRLTSGDVGAVNGIRVTYKFGGKTKRQFFEHAVIVCRTGNNLCTKDNPGRYGERVLTEFGLVPKGSY